MPAKGRLKLRCKSASPSINRTALSFGSARTVLGLLAEMDSPRNMETTNDVRLQGMVEMYQRMLEMISFGRARGYRRLNVPVRRKRVRIARLGKLQRSGMRAGARRLPRLKLRWLSPFVLLAKLRDIYVRLLQAAASKIALSEGIITFPGIFGEPGTGPFPSSRSRSLKAQERELDKILQLYLSRTRSHVLLANSAC